MSEYRKFCYWVDFHGLKTAKENLEERGIELPDEARIPCRVLRASTDVVFLAPPAWSGLCKRRTSWYRQSEMAGKFLVVSTSPLNLPVLRNPITITESNFRPDLLPNSEEISQLIQSREYEKRKPSEWDKPDPLEKEFYQRWFERSRMREPFDLDKILRSHSANHANFIDPRFFVDGKETKAPYSIADSLHVCSSCLEFFNILGEQWTTKYVVPCIGAVQFARLRADQYFEVNCRGCD
jgi:hypothetical protein